VSISSLKVTSGAAKKGEKYWKPQGRTSKSPIQGQHPRRKKGVSSPRVPYEKKGQDVGGSEPVKAVRTRRKKKISKVKRGKRNAEESRVGEKEGRDDTGEEEGNTNRFHPRCGWGFLTGSASREKVNKGKEAHVPVQSHFAETHMAGTIVAARGGGNDLPQTRRRQRKERRRMRTLQK